MTINRLFDIYSTNLALYYPEYKGRFVCPLCKNWFTRDAITANLLSIEHIKPSSIGGTLTTLTCRACNNLHGHALDAKLVARLRFEDQVTGRSVKPVRAEVEIGKGKFTADILFKEGEVKVRGLPKYSNPEQFQSAVNALEAGTNTITFRGRLAFSESEVTCAILRSAYLLMFRFFGYGYVFHQNVEPVRAKIIDPQAETWKTGLIHVDAMSTKNAVALLKEPAELRCFVAMLDLSTETDRHLVVMLPGFDEETDNDVCSRWADMSSDKLESLTPRADVFHYNRAYLTDAHYKHLAFHLWHGMIEVVDAPENSSRSEEIM